jgi:pimeloyl-ACP methyl ester carboxylesterase
LTGPAFPVIGDIIRYTVAPPLAWLLRRPLLHKLFSPEPVAEKFRRGFPLSLALRPWQIRAWAADTLLMVPAAARLGARLDEIELKPVIVAGTRDALVDIDQQARRLHRRLPGSRLIEIEGGGHMIHYTAAEQVVAAIGLAAG